MTMLVFFFVALFIITKAAYWNERHLGPRDKRRTP